MATPKDLEDRERAALDKLHVVAPSPRRGPEGPCPGLDYTVAEVRRTEAKRNPKPPFKTSTLQGRRQVRVLARQTMAVAQQLYEGVNLGGEQVGLITYMRTDSLNLSEQALGEIDGLVASATATATRSTSRAVFAVQDQGCAGGPRGDPPDVGRPDPESCAATCPRAVPPVRAHLEAHRRHADGPGGLRPRVRRRRRHADADGTD
jgi:hypothetical protein